MTDHTPTANGVHPLKRAAARRGIHCNVNPGDDGRVAVVFRRRRDATRFRAATYDLADVTGVRWWTDSWPGSWAKWSTRVTLPADQATTLINALTTGGDQP